MLSFSSDRILLTDTEFLLSDDGTVAVDVFADKIIEQTTTATYHSLKGASCSVVLMVFLKVLGEVFDTIREKSDLAFGATGIGSIFAILFEDFFLLFS